MTAEQFVASLPSDPDLALAEISGALTFTADQDFRQELLRVKYEIERRRGGKRARR